MDANDHFYQRAEAGDGLYAIAWSILRLTTAVRDLGNGSATTDMGAIEHLAKHLGEKLESASTVIAEALETNRN